MADIHACQVEGEDVSCIYRNTLDHSEDEASSTAEAEKARVLKKHGLRQKQYSINDKTYTMTQYLRGKNVNPNVGHIRSVIQSPDGSFVCCAPRKSFPLDQIRQMPFEDLQFEEFIDGTMINAFFDASRGEWDIATRSCVGAKTNFTSSRKSFRDMFMEAADDAALSLNTLPSNFCYTFVLQHPENRIVTPVPCASLYLVDAHEPDGKGNFRWVGSQDLRVIEAFAKTSVQTPMQHEWSSLEEAVRSFTHGSRPYFEAGLVIRNAKTGQRVTVLNHQYSSVKRLRGNGPKKQFQYLSLRSSGNVKDYLSYFPEDANEFATHRDRLHAFTRSLHTEYVACYINKAHHCNDAPYQYRPHLRSLHNKYLQELRPKGEFVNMSVVCDYVNNLPVPRQMFSINYELRGAAKAEDASHQG